MLKWKGLMLLPPTSLAYLAAQAKVVVAGAVAEAKATLGTMSRETRWVGASSRAAAVATVRGGKYIAVQKGGV
jgi:hypothetical protein